MKKLFVILLAVLLLVSFTSCNQDKIDELEKKVAEKEAENEATIQNYEDFMDTYAVWNVLMSDYPSALTPDKDGNISVDFSSDTSTKPTFSAKFLEQFVTLGENESIQDNTDTTKNITVEQASGTVTGLYKADQETKTNTMAFKLTNNSFTIKYNILNEKDTSKNKTGQTVTVSLNGDVSMVSTDNISKTTFKMTVNGTAYDLMAEVYSNYEFKTAKVNGNDVELRLLNKVGKVLSQHYQ